MNKAGKDELFSIIHVITTRLHKCKYTLSIHFNKKDELLYMTCFWLHIEIVLCSYFECMFCQQLAKLSHRYPFLLLQSRFCMKWGGVRIVCSINHVCLYGAMLYLQRHIRIEGYRKQKHLESLISIRILNITYNAHNALEDGKALQQLTVLPVREKQIHFKPNTYIYMLKFI